MAQMLQALLAEREQRDEERREERRRHDEEMARREHEMRQQMELLKGLVEGVNKQGEAALMKLEKDPGVRVAKLTEEDDIEAYLTTFERLMTAYEVKRERWAFKLASQLVGKAQQAYAAMSAEDASDYDKLKKAILRRYDINEESYRQHFRSATKKPGETNRELVARLVDLAEKWMQGCTSIAEVTDVVVLEQVTNTLPGDVRVFVKERKPKTSLEAAELADDYLRARKQNPEATFREEDRKLPEIRPPVGPRRCLRCGKPGHLVRDCRKAIPRPSEAGKEKEPGAKQEKAEGQKKDLKDIECFNCHQKGHYASNCPHRAMFCMERRMDHTGHSKVKRNLHVEKPGIAKPGVVEGTVVSNILLDTGCSRTLVRKDLVPTAKLLDGEVVAIRCAHGDTVLYPLAQVGVEIGGRLLEVEAAVSETLPMAVLLGTDVPELADLLDGEFFATQTNQLQADEALMVTTRAKAKQQQDAEVLRQQSELQSGVKPKALGVHMDSGVASVDEESAKGTEVDERDRESLDGEEKNSWMDQFDEELFQSGREKTKLSRSEKRQNRLKHNPKETPLGLGNTTTPHALDITAEELKVLQSTDSTLDAVRKAASGHPSSAGVRFFERDGLVYRRGRMPGRHSEDMGVDQLILPLQCRGIVLQMAHDIPLAGHLGKENTAQRILYHDVAENCRGCTVCQKSSHHRVRRAPLVPLPIINTPFQRVAMDIVGPLPCSRHGNLVMCVYATHYPEAVTLQSTSMSKLFAQWQHPNPVLKRVGRVRLKENNPRLTSWLCSLTNIKWFTELDELTECQCSFSCSVTPSLTQEKGGGM